MKLILLTASVATLAATLVNSFLCLGRRFPIRFTIISNAVALLIGSSVLLGCGGGASSPAIEEYSIEYPNKASIAAYADVNPAVLSAAAPSDWCTASGASRTASASGSTHEIAYSHFGDDAFWITGPDYGYIAKLDLNGGRTYFNLGEGSAPHGIEFDKNGRMFVSLEGFKQMARVNTLTGAIVELYPIDADAHGVGIGPDGLTIWYTGKLDNVIGKLSTDGVVTNYTAGLTALAKPIYIKAGPDGNMWFTELDANKIGRITDLGSINEFEIPRVPELTTSSRPIAIVPDPRGLGMWFSEEAGNNVTFIGPMDVNGNVTFRQYPVPKTRSDVILAGLSFDRDGNLWTQQYLPKDAAPAGKDYIVKIRKKALARDPRLLTPEDFTFYAVPSTNTVLHRIVQGPDGFMWFTELFADKVGKMNVK